MGSGMASSRSSVALAAADRDICCWQAATLLPDMFTGVSSAVLATAVKVAPKEGDNVQRDKYNQVQIAAGRFSQFGQSMADNRARTGSDLSLRL